MSSYAASSAASSADPKTNDFENTALPTPPLAPRSVNHSQDATMKAPLSSRPHAEVRVSPTKRTLPPSRSETIVSQVSELGPNTTVAVECMAETLAMKFAGQAMQYGAGDHATDSETRVVASGEIMQHGACDFSTDSGGLAVECFAGSLVMDFAEKAVQHGAGGHSTDHDTHAAVAGEVLQHDHTTDSGRVAVMDFAKSAICPSLSDQIASADVQARPLHFRPSVVSGSQPVQILSGSPSLDTDIHQRIADVAQGGRDDSFTASEPSSIATGSQPRKVSTFTELAQQSLEPVEEVAAPAQPGEVSGEVLQLETALEPRTEAPVQMLSAARLGEELRLVRETLERRNAAFNAKFQRLQEENARLKCQRRGMRDALGRISAGLNSMTFEMKAAVNPSAGPFKPALVSVMHNDPALIKIGSWEPTLVNAL